MNLRQRSDGVEQQLDPLAARDSPDVEHERLVTETEERAKLAAQRRVERRRKRIAADVHELGGCSSGNERIGFPP